MRHRPAHRRTTASTPAWPLLLLLAAGPASAETAKAVSTPPEAAVSRSDVAPVLGRQVWDEDGVPIGRIVDVLVDGAGASRAAVVDAGGFMGLGQRRVAIAWSAMHFTPGSDRITLGLKRDQVAALPEYKPAGTGPVVVASPTPASPAPTPK